MRKFHIYFIGVIGLGLAHGWLKSIFPAPAVFGIAIVYLILLRLIAEKFGKDKPQ